LQFVFLGNKKPTFLHAVGSPDVDGMEGSDIYFDVCNTKIRMWPIYGCIYLTIYLFVIGLQEMKEIFSNLLFIWVKKI